METFTSAVSADMLTLSSRYSPSERYFLLLHEDNSNRPPNRGTKYILKNFRMSLLLAIVYGQTGKLIVVLVLTALYTL